MDILDSILIDGEIESLKEEIEKLKAYRKIENNNTKIMKSIIDRQETELKKLNDRLDNIEKLLLELKNEKG